MGRISLYIPELEDYWYEQKLESDEKTMNYNAGYDVNYMGYHYNTGCIDFPFEKWEDTYDRRKKNNEFFAYIKDNQLEEFVGYCNYRYTESTKRYECGIVIEAQHRGKGYSKEGIRLFCEHAKKEGVKELYDSFEMDRGNTLEIFESVGFKVVQETSWKKFGKKVKGVIVKIEL